MYIPRLQKISKYWLVRCSGAPASSSASRKLRPSIGVCAVPFTLRGSSIPAAARMVGATSITWVNWVRVWPPAWNFAGHFTIIGLRVPPRWLATCLVQGKGVSIAKAQPAGKWLKCISVPISSMRSSISSVFIK
ncbi:hypothetical protein D3C71_1287070 [compost metagenome]